MNNSTRHVQYLLWAKRTPINAVKLRNKLFLMQMMREARGAERKYYQAGLKVVK